MIGVLIVEEEKPGMCPTEATPCEDTVRRSSAGLRRNQLHHHLDLGLPASKTLRE